MCKNILDPVKDVLGSRVHVSCKCSINVNVNVQCAVVTGKISNIWCWKAHCLSENLSKVKVEIENVNHNLTKMRIWSCLIYNSLFCSLIQISAIHLPEPLFSTIPKRKTSEDVWKSAFWKFNNRLFGPHHFEFSRFEYNWEFTDRKLHQGMPEWKSWILMTKVIWALLLESLLKNICYHYLLKITCSLLKAGPSSSNAWLVIRLLKQTWTVSKWGPYKGWLCFWL